MGIMRIIDMCVAFVILFIFFMIFRLLLFPDPDLSVEKLPPEQLMRPLWRFIVTVGYTIFKWIIIIIFAIWVFWHILKLIPIIGQIIIAVVPPFRQLEKAGIFRLYDDLVWNIITFNLVGVFRALIRFFKTSGQYIVQSITGVSIKQKQKQIVQNITSVSDITYNNSDTGASSSSKSTTSGTSSNTSTNSTISSNTPTVTTSGKETSTKTTETKQEEIQQDAEQESKYTPAERKAIEDKLQICISQNTTPVYSSMKPMDKAKIQVNNQNAILACRANSVGDYVQTIQVK